MHLGEKDSPLDGEVSKVLRDSRTMVQALQPCTPLPTGRGAGKEKEKEKVAHLRREKAAHPRLEKVKRQCSAQTASAPPTVRAFTATYAPRLLLMSAASTRMAPAPTRNNNSTNTTEASPSGTPPPLALSCAPNGV